MVRRLTIEKNNHLTCYSLAINPRVFWVLVYVLSPETDNCPSGDDEFRFNDEGCLCQNGILFWFGIEMAIMDKSHMHENVKLDWIAKEREWHSKYMYMYFMINLHEGMLPHLVGIKPSSSWSPVGNASDWASEAGLNWSRRHSEIFYHFLLKSRYVLSCESSVQQMTNVKCQP